MRRPLVVTAAGLVLLAGACTDDPPARDAAPAPAASTTTPPGTSAPPSTPAPEAGVEGDAPFPADLQDDTGGVGQGDLALAAVRVARQDGYDRVVLELTGPGEPGWSSGWVGEPTAQGSGDPVEVAGDSTLVVALRPVGQPEDTGLPAYAGPRSTGPADARQVREVLLGSVFEADQEVFVGVAGPPRPFRVFALTDPPRLVIDVRDA